MTNDIEIRQCILVNNDCYKQGRKITPNGIVVHSTGANNPYIKRYVQPDDGVLGVNKYNNHWNKSGVQKCVHAFIGKDKDEKIRVYQTLPWDYRCWGCGSGKKGSYNNNYIQFEICEDALTDINYFNEAFELAIKLCVYLRDKFNLPVHNIVSHHESWELGYGCNHKDCDHWLRKFGKDMNWLRTQVSNRVNVIPTMSVIPTTTVTRSYLMKGDTGEEVKILQENLNYIGYSCGNADGNFGTKTETALIKFQDSYNLTVDGKYGSVSKKTLENAVAKKKASYNTTSKFVYKSVDYSPVFDPTFYANEYSDLKSAFGTNVSKLWNHFTTHGMVEGRQAHAKFNVNIYKNRYDDLQKAFGSNLPAYYQHYCQFGEKEGRSAI